MVWKQISAFVKAVGLNFATLSHSLLALLQVGRSRGREKEGNLLLALLECVCVHAIYAPISH